MRQLKPDRIEGYWYSELTPQYPMPVPNDKPWEGQQAFLDKLETIENEAKTLHAKGWSNCRVCDCINGSVEYMYNGWRWPIGFHHYIAEHNVKPSADFIAMIEGVNL